MSFEAIIADHLREICKAIKEHRLQTKTPEKFWVTLYRSLGGIRAAFEKRAKKQDGDYNADL